jgi:mitochondrial translocator assembly and maintenance protein 41
VSSDSLPSASSKTSRDSAVSDADGSETSWEDDVNRRVEEFKDLPYANFGVNQHMPLNEEFKKVLRSIVWQIKAPVRYAFAYGSGVFPQSKPTGRIPTDEELRAIHPNAPEVVQKTQNGTPKMIDFIFGVGHTQHFHSLNMRYNPSHYSGLARLGSAAVSHVQDRWGAGVYFHPYVVVNGILIKYGVVNIHTLERDLTEWETLYLAGRLHKPVKIIRDDPQIRLANQINLIAALRTALLLLPPEFTETQLYSTIAGISYLGDPRMSLPTENPRKVKNIVGNNLPNFRRLYLPLIDTLPNMEYVDPRATEKDWIWDENADLRLVQDMDPVKRGNMVRRLPKQFRARLYFQYQKKLAIPKEDFDKMMAESNAEDTTSFRRRQGGGFERRIAQDDPEELRQYVRTVIKQTIGWPSTTQSLKAVLTAGIPRTIRYLREKFEKWQEGRAQKRTAEKEDNETEAPTSQPKKPTAEAPKATAQSKASGNDETK